MVWHGLSLWSPLGLSLIVALMEVATDWELVFSSSAADAEASEIGVVFYVLVPAYDYRTDWPETSGYAIRNWWWCSDERPATAERLLRA